MASGSVAYTRCGKRSFRAESPAERCRTTRESSASIAPGSWPTRSIRRRNRMRRTPSTADPPRSPRTWSGSCSRNSGRTSTANWRAIDPSKAIFETAAWPQPASHMPRSKRLRPPAHLDILARQQNLRGRVRKGLSLSNSRSAVKPARGAWQASSLQPEPSARRLWPARNHAPHDPVKLRGRRYSPDGRRSSRGVAVSTADVWACGTAR